MIQKHRIASSPSLILLLIFVISIICQINMSVSASDSSKPAVQIVYTERPQDEEPEAYHMRTLASVLGSEDAAKEALVYSYKTAASGFSCKLTPEQVDQMSKQPGVLQVVPSKTVQLHSGPAKLH
ncbi:subtilisin-like protease SBT3.10 [Mercurialis annua]|uniref:subtilisin-like protease SBT3.10 n=1 Tax=Mercurialis annua TaxID=3986 RepID=UPI00215F79E4|nr:subtilisin-like protease SBT3.10 [Mercurialis annua]